MGYELTGNSISSTYARLVQHVSDNYYDGAGNILGIVSDTSLQNYVAKAGDAMTGNLTINASLFVNGNIGIGTTEPSTALHIISDGTTSSMIRADVGLILDTVPPPPAFTCASLNEVGNMPIGTHYYFISYNTSLGSTNLTGTSQGSTMGDSYGMKIVTDASHSKASLSLTKSNDYRVIGINIYRTLSSTTDAYLLATAPNETGDWIDNYPDSSLGSIIYYSKENETNKQIYIDSVTRGMLLGQGSTYVGKNAGKSITTGGKNTFIGSDAGAVATTSSGSVYVGRGAGQTSNGSFNVGIGYQSMLSSAGTGSYNIAIGINSQLRNTTGTHNTAMGSQALRENTTGTNNVAIGGNTLQNNTTSNSNVAIGGYALFNLTSGHYNTAIGYNAIGKQRTGTATTAIGYNAGAVIADSTTDNSICNYGLYLGGNTKASTLNNTNEIVIGYNAIGNGSNSVTLGADTITKTILRANVGIGTTAPAFTLDVSGNINAKGYYADGSVGFTGDVSAGQTMRFKNGILIQVL
jgi:hypothetical protein